MPRKPINQQDLIIAGLLEWFNTAHIEAVRAIYPQVQTIVARRERGDGDNGSISANSTPKIVRQPRAKTTGAAVSTMPKMPSSIPLPTSHPPAGAHITDPVLPSMDMV